MKLVAVAVGADDDRVPRRDGDLAHGLLRERRQLVRPATVDGDARGLNWPDMLLTKSTWAPSRVNARSAPKRR